MFLNNYEKELIKNATLDTLYLIAIVGVALTIIGIVLGFILFFTKTKSNQKNNTFTRIIHYLTSITIDFFRSVPFIILMIILIPFTVIIVGTMLGANASIPALIISASPFYARIVYNSLCDINNGPIEALESLGANRFTIIKALIKEALPSLIRGLTVTLVSLVGFIAAAGAVGAGGLGDLARRRALALDYKIMYISVGLLLLIVFIIQISGDLIAKKIDKKN